MQRTSSASSSSSSSLAALKEVERKKKEDLEKKKHVSSFANRLKAFDESLAEVNRMVANSKKRFTFVYSDLQKMASTTAPRKSQAKQAKVAEVARKSDGANSSACEDYRDEAEVSAKRVLATLLQLNQVLALDLFYDGPLLGSDVLMENEKSTALHCSFKSEKRNRRTLLERVAAGKKSVALHNMLLGLGCGLEEAEGDGSETDEYDALKGKVSKKSLKRMRSGAGRSTTFSSLARQTTTGRASKEDSEQVPSVWGGRVTQNIAK